MAVEAVTYIFSVRHVFDDAVFLTELLYLKTAKVLCRCSVNGIKIAVLFLEIIDFFINMLQNLQCKLSILYQGFLII